MRRSILPVALCLVACQGPGGGGGGATPTAGIAPGTTPTTGATPTATGTGGPAGVDADGDGAVEGVDCDDLDPASAPGKIEVACDGRDNDCVGGDDRAGCDLTWDSASLVLTGFDGVHDGGVAVSQDLTGDGATDLVVTGHTGVEWAALGFALNGADPALPAFTLVSGGTGEEDKFVNDLTGDGAADVLTQNGLVPGPLTGRVDASESQFPDLTASAGGAYLGVDTDRNGVVELVSMLDAGPKWVAPPFTSPVEVFNCYTPIPVDFDGASRNILQQADLDGDGSLDLIAGTVHRDRGDPTDGVSRMDMRVVLGQGQAVENWCTWGWNLFRDHANDFDFADFNGDGIGDVVGLSDRVEVAYGPFPVSGGEDDLAQIADLVLEGAESTEAHVVPDATGDGLPDLLFTCDDRVVLASLASPGRVRDACEAGRTVEVSEETATQIAGLHGAFELTAGADLDGDGLTDVVVFDKATGGARIWFGADF